ncbi:MAG: hypothetical protein ACKOWF_12525 [Chloroflexota bacterium]
MDSQRFDHLVAAFSRGLTRRAGLGFGLAASLAALIGADPAEAGRNRGRNQNGPAARRARDAGRRSPGIAGPCGDGSREANRCTRDNQCCTGICERSTGKRNKDGEGRCRCRKRRGTCTETRNCCGRLRCYGGRCSTCQAGCAAGCCAGDTCVTEVSNAQCGINGAACVACAEGSECVGGACAIICTVTVDPTILAGEISPTPAGGSTIGISAHGDRVYFTQIHKRNRVGSMNLDGSDLKWGPRNSYKQRLSGITVNPNDGTIIAMEYRWSNRVFSVDPVTLGWTNTEFSNVNADLPWAAEFGDNGILWYSLDNQDAVGQLGPGITTDTILTPVCGGSTTRGARDLGRGPGGLMFATCFEVGKVVAIDTATATVLPESYAVPNAYGVAFNGSTMYVVASANPVLIHEVVVTIENGKPVYTPRCVHTMAGRKQAGMATVDKNGKLWVSRGAGRVKHKPNRN